MLVVQSCKKADVLCNLIGGKRAEVVVSDSGDKCIQEICWRLLAKAANRLF
jgi:hypothetical protein